MAYIVPLNDLEFKKGLQQGFEQCLQKEKRKAGICYC